MGSVDPTSALLPEADPFGLLGARLEGKFDIEAVVAEGGFGVVYRGLHHSLNKAIAVKVLKVPEELPATLRREYFNKFAQEARTIALLEHPAIVRVLDFGASPMPRGEAAPWMVLEWLEGATLEEDFAARHGCGRTPAEALRLLRPVLEALAYAHDEGVAHRDIKPSNIMLTTNRRGETLVKLLDFGIAKSMGDGERATSGLTATKTALPAFSPRYAAPEQLSGSRTGPWTDVHAMALVLGEALRGAPMYSHSDSTGLYAEVLAPVRPTPAKFGLDVGPWEPVLQRALAVRPEERFGHMRAFLEALQSAAEATPPQTLLAPPPLSHPPATPSQEATTTGYSLAPQATGPDPSAPRPIAWTVPQPSSPSRSRWMFAAAGALVFCVGTASLLLRGSPAEPPGLSASIPSDTSPAVAAPVTSVAVPSAPPTAVAPRGCTIVRETEFPLRPTQTAAPTGPSIAAGTAVDVLQPGRIHHGSGRLFRMRVRDSGDEGYAFLTERELSPCGIEVGLSPRRNVARLTPSTVRASSHIVLRDRQYPPILAFDGDRSTAWNEGAPGHGQGEWIEAAFATPARIRRIVLTTGWDDISRRGEDLFTGNAHLRRVVLEVDGQPLRTLEVAADDREITFERLNVIGSTVRIVAADTWPGTRWADFCIAEVSIEGALQPSATAPSANSNQE